MRAFFQTVALIVSLGAGVALVSPASSIWAAQAAHYSTSDTDIGTLLDDPKARAVVDKHIANFSKGEQIDLARSMTLKQIQQFSPDVITDKVLSAIDVDFAKLPVKK